MFAQFGCTADEPAASVDESVDYLVQYRICIPDTDRWESSSPGDKKAAEGRTQLFGSVKVKNDASKDGPEAWRVMEVRRKVIYP